MPNDLQGRDQWTQWLLHRRHGGDPDRLKAALEFLYPIRDRVLDHAHLAPGAALLDVGAGDGLVAFGALERVGAGGRVLFSDISQDLLDHSRALAAAMGALDRCAFLLASADDLRAVPDESVDAVTTRSVLIYVKDKRASLREFYRVLKPGGWLSVFEPINRFGYPEPPGILWGCDVTPVEPLAAKVRDLYRRLQPLQDDPMLDFDERDLLLMAEAAGFACVNMELRAEMSRATASLDWQGFISYAPNPKVPTLSEALAQALTPDEAARFEAHLRPLVEQGQRTSRSALMYLWAQK